MKVLSFSIISLLLISHMSIGEEIKETTHANKKVIRVFKENGCINCHKLHNVAEFTPYGEWAKTRGYGCVNLLTLIRKAHNIKGPAITRAREVFIQNKCSVCHDVEGKGTGRENLTPHGVKMKKANLGCTGVYKELLKVK